MNLRILILLFLAGLASAQQNETPRTKSLLVDQVRALSVLEGHQEKRLKEIETALSAIKQRPDLGDEDRKKIGRLLEDQQKAQLEHLELVMKLEEISSNLSKQGEDFESLKSSVELLKAQREKSNSLEETLKRLEEAPESFKNFTRMISRIHREEVTLELEADQDGKRVPLAGKSIKTFKQFKEGKLEPLETAVTDPNGVVIIKRPASRSLLSPTYLVFQFNGDSSYRPSQSRVKIR